MAGTFPTLSCGHSLRYPFRVRYSCLTRVQYGVNRQSQRHVVRAPMAEFTATYRNLTVADRDAIQTFFDAQKGAFDSSWSLPWLAHTYTSMRFLEDAIRWEETRFNRWTTTLSMRGFVPASAMSSPPATLPPLPSGAMTQGWAKATRYVTNLNDLESGTRYALALRVGGLSGFPASPERVLEVQLRAVTPATMDSFVRFFLATLRGRLNFTLLTDPDTAVGYFCYAASDDFEVSFDGFNRCAATLTLEAL